MAPKSLATLLDEMKSSDNEQTFIQSAFITIHNECKSRDRESKVCAIQKLVFLYILGYDIKQYAFNTIECICSQDILTKRVGYLASYFSFGSPDMQTLSTNLYLKDIQHKSTVVRQMALSSLASCPAPNREQVHTLIPVLFDLLKKESSKNVAQYTKIIATTTRVLYLAKRQEIEGVFEFANQFVDILYSLVSANQITSDAVMTQVYVSAARQLAFSFGCEAVMKLVPSIYDIFGVSKQQQIMVLTASFFTHMGKFDARIKDKTRWEFLLRLKSSDSPTLFIELLKAVAQLYPGDDELMRISAGRVSNVLATTDDTNLQVTILKELSALELVAPGTVVNNGLSSTILNFLDSKDYNVRTQALIVACNCCSPDNIMQIVEKLLLALKDSRLSCFGASLKEMHQVSSSDVQFFRSQIVENVLRVCTANGYRNVGENVDWFINVLLTLTLEYPKLAAQAAATELMRLVLRSEALRPSVPRLADVVFSSTWFKQIALSNSFGQQVSGMLSLVGPASTQDIAEPQDEIRMFENVLCCQYGTCQFSTSEIIDSIKDTSQIQRLFKTFHTEMESRSAVFKTVKSGDQVIYATDNRLYTGSSFIELRAASQMLQTCAWALGTCFYIQPASAGSIDIIKCMKLLLTGIDRVSADTAMTFILAALKAFTTTFQAYISSELFVDEAKCQEYVQFEYFNDVDFDEKIELVFIEQKTEQAKKKRQHKHKVIEYQGLQDHDAACDEVQDETQEAVDETQNQEPECEQAQDVVQDEVQDVPDEAPQEEQVQNLQYDQQQDDQPPQDDQEQLEQNEAQPNEEVLEGDDEVSMRRYLADAFAIALFVLIKHVASLQHQQDLQPVCQAVFKTIAQQQSELRMIQKVCSPPLALQMDIIFEQFAKVPVNEEEFKNTLFMLYEMTEFDAVAQRRTARPSCTFANGQTFSLDDSNGVIQSKYDAEEFTFEESRNQVVEEKKATPKDPTKPEQQSPKYSVRDQANSAFYIGKIGAKAEKNVVRKFDVLIGAFSPQAAVETVPEEQPTERRRKKRHHGEGNLQFEPREIEQAGEDQAEAVNETEEVQAYEQPEQEQCVDEVQEQVVDEQVVQEEAEPVEEEVQEKKKKRKRKHREDE